MSFVLESPEPAQATKLLQFWGGLQFSSDLESSALVPAGLQWIGLLCWT